MNRFPALIAAALMAAAPAFAQTEHSGHHLAQKSEAKADALADGEVKKVDKDAGKVTIKHGPLPTLDMPAMSMVFRVKDPSMLDKLKAGDKIRFKAEKVGGNYTVMHYEPAK
jgi:Cu(I)/Ag(I) efflux system protein CusF